MSFAATFDTFANVRNVTPGARLVLAAISTFSNKQGTCFPSLKAIAERTSLTVRSVQRHLASLISLGYIERIYRTGRSALTRINLARLSPALDTGGGDKNDTTGGDKNDVQNLPVQPTTIKAVHEPATIEPLHQQATAPVAAMPPLIFEIKQPEPQHQAIPGIESLPDYGAQLQVFANSQYAPTEAPKTPVTPSNEADPAIPTLDTNQATQDQAVEADPVEAEWAKVDPQVLLDLMEIRKAKKKAPKPTKTEVKHWYSIALAEGWTLPQLAYALVLKNWSRVEPGWLQHVPRPQMTATGTPATPAAPKVWTPDQNHTPASPGTLAKMREQIAKMKARWKEESLNAPPPIRR